MINLGKQTVKKESNGCETMKLNPTLDRVVIKKCEFEEVFKSSLILVDRSKDNINKMIFEVVEVGPGGSIMGGKKGYEKRFNVEMLVKPGDKVIVPEYVGSEIYMDGVQYRILKQSDILAIIE